MPRHSGPARAKASPATNIGKLQLAPSREIWIGCEYFLETGKPFSPQAPDRGYILYRCRYRGVVMTYQDLSPWVHVYDAEPMLELRERRLAIRLRFRRKRRFLLAVDIVLFCSVAAMTAHGLGLVTL